MARALNLIHGCAGLIREGWPPVGLPWERLLDLVQEHGVQLGMVFLGRHARAGAPEGGGGCQKGGSAAERDTREALGRSRGGYGTKACVIADGQGRAIAFRLAPGQAHEFPHAAPLLDQLPGVPKWVVGVGGYTSLVFRKPIWNMGARPAIPPQRHEAPVACPDWIYNRN